jgi:hypothetical protein
VRDRIVECYFWSYTVHYDEANTRARMILAKLFLTSLLDDTYDVHATLEEARELNKAIERLVQIDQFFREKLILTRIWSLVA